MKALKNNKNSYIKYKINKYQIKYYSMQNK